MEKDDQSLQRYFGLCTDHKVIGMQYLVGIGVFFFIGGLNAMLIRTELLRPSPNVFPPDQYLTLVGMHGTMMMGMMTSGILGPFANYVVPLMIGARRMAFPRIEALTFWLLMAAGVVLTTTIFFGGFQTGWTGYDPLSDQGQIGMDSYLLFFALVGISMMLLGLNLLATIITMRAPGITWSRLPIFCWSVVATTLLMVLAAPVLSRRCSWRRWIARPRRHSSSPARRQLVPVREPLLGLRPPGGLRARAARVRHRARTAPRLRAQAALGIPRGRRRDARGGLLSFFVWQHHLFVSGINADLRPFYMLSTEIISIPTGFIFLVAMGTVWRGRMRFSVPMLFCLGVGLQLPDRRCLGGLPLGRAE